MKQQLAAAGERDGEHFRFAPPVGLLAIAVGLACLVHAVIAALGVRTWSTIIARLQHLFAERRILEQVAEQSSGALAFVALALLPDVAILAPIVAGAAVGASALAAPLAFLLFHPEFDIVRASACLERLSWHAGERRHAAPRLLVGDNSPKPVRHAHHALAAAQARRTPADVRKTCAT
ncbi:MAG: DUF6356 family protein [Sphingomonas bacterium]|nr:DUF6356 family protein [Sphingomonas bacterium]